MLVQACPGADKGESGHAWIGSRLTGMDTAAGTTSSRH